MPLPVRRKEIPKPNGGVRLLGIPTVVDRLIQQAITQVLQGIWDPTFSDKSFGFRPGRSAHDALRCAKTYVQEGYRYIVDIDLEKFFDQVNHDKLMSRLATRVYDRRVLGLIRRYLTAGVMTVVWSHLPTGELPKADRFRLCFPILCWINLTKSWKSADCASSDMRTIV